ncbi:MAG: RNA methyltransferase [Bdellovibrionales bacterium]|nr:RNA methyltransferase [Bdellovibrionales bacterium]
MKIHVVLVRPMYSRNLGAAARALANMGGDDLILINPQCEANSASREAAAGAQEWLARRRTYLSWNEFYAHEGEGVRLGFTRRPGKTRKLYALEDALEELTQLDNLKAHPHVYLFFGPEDHGLSAEDLAYMNFNCQLPVYGEFSSLNLSQAVLLALYICRHHFDGKWVAEYTDNEAAQEILPAYIPDMSIKRWLKAMGFQLEARKSSAFLTLRRLFLANNPTRHEREVLEAILQQNIRKLEEYNQSRSKEVNPPSS